MHPLWKFKGQFQGLREAVARGPGEFNFRPIAAELRGILLDTGDIVDAANKMFQLSVFFPLLPSVEGAAFAARRGGSLLNERLLAGPPTRKAPGAKVDHVSRDDFLALTAVRLPDGSAFSLRDVVVAGSNLAGGVHGSPRGADGKRLEPLANALFGPGICAGHEFLSAAARCVLEAYQHLFTLAEGVSLGLAQPRPEHQPILRMDLTQGQASIGSFEFAGSEFFEDGLPAGLGSAFAWVGTLALRMPDVGGSAQMSPWVDRHILDIGPCGEISGPRFSIVQRGRSILTRAVTSEGNAVTTRPLRLKNHRFYAVASGVAEVGGRVRVFLRIHGGDPRSVEAFGPPGVGMGTPQPSRLTMGAGLQRSEARAGRGALMQVGDQVFLPGAPESDLTLCLEGFWRNCLSRRWAMSSHPELRVDTLYNQMCNATGNEE